MDNPLSNLNLKWWFSVLMTISFFIFVLSLTVQFPSGGISNATLQFFSSGTFFIALGSFANLSTQQGVAKLMGVTGKIEKDTYKMTTAGGVLYVVGFLLLVGGLFKTFTV